MQSASVQAATSARRSSVVGDDGDAVSKYKGQSGDIEQCHGHLSGAETSWNTPLIVVGLSPPSPPATTAGVPA